MIPSGIFFYFHLLLVSDSLICEFKFAQHRKSNYYVNGKLNLPITIHDKEVIMPESLAV